ncbi:unnamed protein product [marine sediment metagenome]|uniref:Uncharacterized protein n=1 Tax=marine sediment metagenome TaxID=412755 RepID=X1PGJ3_9ZZZZ
MEVVFDSCYIALYLLLCRLNFFIGRLGPEWHDTALIYVSLIIISMVAMGLVENAFQEYLSGLRAPVEMTFIRRTFSGPMMLAEMEQDTPIGRDFRRKLLQCGFDWIGRTPFEFTVDDFLEKLAIHIRGKPPIIFGVGSYPEAKTFTTEELAAEVEARSRWGMDYAQMVLASAIKMRLGR